ncbi:MAG: hypothetical protein Q8Q23_01845 [bacterium]|nr:hypothetical protein [bacterium]
MIKLRKIFTVSVMLVTVLAMSVVVAPDASAAASTGDLIKMNGLSSVYYLGADGKRYVFPNESSYFSWYADFSGVVTISQSELESYPLGSNVTVRPGTKLVKITTNPKVYVVEPNGELVWLPDETIAKILFGDMWAQRVIDVPDPFWNNYTETSRQVSASAYPTGSLVKFGSAADVYYIASDGSARSIASESAFLANRFKWSDVITAPASVAMPAAGTVIAGAEAALLDTSSGAGGTPVDPNVGSGLSVSLASDTPAAGDIPANSPNTFLKLNLTAASDGAVKVNTIKLTSYGLGTPTYIDSVTFYDNGIRVGTAKNINSDHEAVFNFATPIEVAAGTTKSLVVKATIESSRTGNFALGVAKAADITTNGASVSGSFPIQGNTMTAVSVSIGTITMSSVGTTDTSNDFGEDRVLLAKFNLAAANEPVLWESMRLTNGGTNVVGIVGNLTVNIDGDDVLTGVEMNGKYADFNLNNLLIAKNDTITVEVYGDVGLANVDNKVQMFIDDIGDLVFTGQDFGYGIQLASNGLSTASTGIIVTLASGDVTIDFDKSATPSKDVRPGENDVILGTLTILSAGENATITGITDNGADEFSISGTTLSCSEITNGEMKDTGTGAVYDLAIASSTTATKCKLTLADDITLVKGVKKTYQIRVDVEGPNDTAPADVNDTFQITLEDGAFTITGDESNDDLSDNITPTSITSAIATVKAASLTWSTTSLSAKTVVTGAQNVVVYRAVANAGASSAVTVTSLALHASDSNGDAFTDNNIAQLRLYFDGKLVKTSAGNITEGTAAVTPTVTFSSLDTTNRVIPAGTAVVVEVQADFSGSFSPAGGMALEIDSDTTSILAQDKDSDAVTESVSNSGTLSRTVTLATVGTLKVELLTTDTKANNDTFILAGTSTRANNYLAELKFTTANEPIKIKTLVLEEQGSSTSSDVAYVHLYDSSGAIIASKVPSTAGHANFDDLNKVIPADQATSWFIGVTTKTINADGDPEGTATYGREIQYSIASTAGLAAWSLSANKAITAQGSESGTDITLVNGGDGVNVGEYSASTTASKLATTTGSRLTSVTNAMSDGNLAGGNDKIVGKFKFVFDNGTNRTSGNEELKAEMRQLILTIASSTTTNLTNIQVYIEGDASNKTTAVQPNGSSVATVTMTQLSGTTEKVDGEVTLVVEGDVTTSGTSQYAQVNIASLVTDFTFNGNDGTTAMHWTDVSSDLGIVGVNGGTLSN